MNIQFHNDSYQSFVARQISKSADERFQIQTQLQQALLKNTMSSAEHPLELLVSSSFLVTGRF
jgi:hypothetical protein